MSPHDGADQHGGDMSPDDGAELATPPGLRARDFVAALDLPPELLEVCSDPRITAELVRAAVETLGLDPAGLLDRSDRLVTAERVHVAVGNLVWTYQYEPDRLLNDRSIEWMETIAALLRAGVIFPRSTPAIDELAPTNGHDATTASEPAPTRDEPAPTRDEPAPTRDGPAPQPTAAVAAQHLEHLEQPEIENLRASGLTDAEINRFGAYTLRDPVRIDEIACMKMSRKPRIDPRDPTRIGTDVELVTMVIPCPQPDGSCPKRLRLRHPTPRRDPAAEKYERDPTKKYERDPETGKWKSAKYTSPKGMSPPFSWPGDALTSGALTDPTCPVFLCEGEKKAAQLAWILKRLGIRAVVIALPGIDNAHDVKYRDDELARGVPKEFCYRLRTELREHVAWTGRKVVICFDYYAHKDEAHWAAPNDPKKKRAREPGAAQRITDTLYDAGASEVWFCVPPSAATKGLDDLYVAAALGGRAHDLTRDCAETLDADAGCAAVMVMIDGAALQDHSQGGGPGDAARAADNVRFEAEMRAAVMRAGDVARSTADADEPAPHETAPAAPASAQTATPPERVRIEATPGEADTSLRAIEQALEGGRAVFVRGGRLVRVGARAGKAPSGHRGTSEMCLPRVTVGLWTSESLAVEISRVAELTVWNPVTSKFVPGIAPTHLTHALIDRGSWEALPELTGVIEVPAITREGRVVCERGYDAATGLYLQPRTAALTTIATGTSPAEARDAYRVLAKHVAEFPFVAPHDCAAWVAYTLTIAARYAIGGPVPAFTFSAPAKGTGKTFLTQIGSIIGAGYGCADAALARGEERDKALTALALRSARTVRFDNLKSTFADDRLEQALTTGTWSGRLLGGNNYYTGEWQAVVSATGIGLTIGSEMSRRIVPCMLDAGMEHPEDRASFVQDDIVAATIESLPQLSAAALTILRAHGHAGRPRGGIVKMGDYPAWDDVVRAAVHYAADVDPLGGRAAMRERVSEVDATVALLAALHSFGARHLGTGGSRRERDEWCPADIASCLATPPGENDAYRELRGAVDHARENLGRGRGGPVSQQAITALLSKLAGAKRGGYTLHATGSPKRGRTYRVEADK